jgi:hypothetical protein
MTTSEIALVLRERPCVLRVGVRRNDDPARLGCDLLDLQLPADAAAGFAVCEAVVETDLAGYAAAFGWIQVVRSSDDATGGTAYDLDPLTLFRDVDTPFAFFGIRPVFFDAPFRATRDDLTWEAETFLCVLPDAVMSRSVLGVAGFRWGFALRGGELTLQEPTPLDRVAWTRHIPMLAGAHPSWRFL